MFASVSRIPIFFMGIDPFRSSTGRSGYLFDLAEDLLGGNPGEDFFVTKLRGGRPSLDRLKTAGAS